ncbi:MAG TPA: zinc metallopeptidase [Thermomicrobiales bacterium]|jgi:Zn-dependent membrane protease YugP|nr:zinc metallopeptidase [Chloroflexota bacterium]HQX62586.1 zinc metallopeptidase [Thermomicrobiales bacterium]HQZ89913.1 zinc metallopeptidase [Thermomicrobiales bacterium]HRA31478.1 zinc metallopeptidase [Thermomicrobiales bacterium]
MFFFDPLYFVFMLPAIALVMFAQYRVKSTFQKYSQVQTNQGITGAQAAAEILRSNGITDVQIERIQGSLSDHYDPRSKVLRLSEPVYGSKSVAAVGVAAHECGHALQHAQGYAPLAMRSAIVPVANIGSMIGPIMLIAGIVIGLTQLAWIGIAFFAAGTVFALVTLPVEFNASARAMQQLSTIGIFDRTEYAQGRKVLNAAALTYVAGFAAALLQLLYYISLVSGARGRD